MARKKGTGGWQIKTEKDRNLQKKTGTVAVFNLTITSRVRSVSSKKLRIVKKWKVGNLYGCYRQKSLLRKGAFEKKFFF